MYATVSLKAMKFVPAFAACLLYSTASGAGILSSPENYHECLLERLPDVQNDVVAASENSQCRVAFPDSTPPEKVDPGWLGPETVAECLAEFGTNTPSSYAANLIREACFQLYPEQPAE